MKSLLSRVFSAFLLLLWVSVSWAFEEGTDYTRVAQPGATDDPATIEVREFFWFGCPHCFTLEGELTKWRAKMPEGVRFVRTPPALNPAWEPHAHAYYVAEALGMQDALSTALFDAMHVEKRALRSEDDLARFFEEKGVSEDKFRELYHSFSVRTQVRKARTLGASYQLHGVPAIVVNGKYLVELSKAKSYPRMMDIVNFLVAREKAAGTR